MNNTKCTFTKVENGIKDHSMSIMEIAQLVPVLAILTPYTNKAFGGSRCGEVAEKVFLVVG
jgi:hypothetical protein